MARAQIHGKEYPIQDVLCDKFLFEIPRYQRPYSWGIEQAETLLDDLLSAIGNLEDSTDDTESYFLGSVVVVKEEGIPKAEVVDGQQRLTTLTILFAAIRATITDQEFRDELTSFIYHKGKASVKLPDCFYLTLREKDALYFQEIIQKDVNLAKVRVENLAELSDSQKNIVRNCRIYLSKLKSFTDEQLKTLSTYILMQCYLIMVSTPTVESAYRIFSIFCR